MSTTPRTDAARLTEPYLVQELSFEVVRAEVMEELETELAAVTATGSDFVRRDVLEKAHAEVLILQSQIAGYLLSIAASDPRNEIIFATIDRLHAALGISFAAPSELERTKK
jgi:phage I-like protein